MRIGAHVSSAGGLLKALDRAVELGTETMQLFCSSPQGWAFKTISQAEMSDFRQKATSFDIGPIFLHGIYLVNLGTSNQANLRKGIESLGHYMRAASNMGASGVIFHAGNHNNTSYEVVFRQTVNALKEVLADSPKDVWLIIENGAGMRNQIGSTFRELGGLIKATGDSRVKICLDTQHCFAAGYNITQAETIAEVMTEFDQEIGLENLVAVHANDSKQPLACRVDRHENLGEGYIGLDGFLAIMKHPAFQTIPFLLEVPGFNGGGPDKENIGILRNLRERAGESTQ